jgi:hypothetical protein
VHLEELAPDAEPQRIFLPASSDGNSNPDTAAATATEPGELGAAEETEVQVLPSLAFGMREREKKMVFEHLPMLSADTSTRREMNALCRVNAEEVAAHHAGALAAGVRQANVMAALVDLRNANVAGIAFENRRRVIVVFSEPGRMEVQGTYSPLLFALRFNCLSWGGSRPYPSFSACRMPL